MLQPPLELEEEELEELDVELDPPELDVELEVLLDPPELELELELEVLLDPPLEVLLDPPELDPPELELLPCPLQLGSFDGVQ